MKGALIRRWRSVLAPLVMLAVSACAVGPDYAGPPDVAVGDGWVEASREPTAALDLDAWWYGIGDPVLGRLVEEGVQHNLDARQAVLRIAEARAALRASESRRLPSLDARAAANRRRLSENGVLPVGGASGIERDDTIYDAALDANWEVDLFGRVSRSVESASAQLDAVEEDARAIRVSVAAEIARTYFGLRGAQRERAAREASIAALEQSYALAEQRVRSGDLARAELDSVAARLSVARAGLPGLEARLHGSALALGTLLGALPEKELALELTGMSDLALPAIPIGERADLLRRRPDIRASERRLAAATSQVGIAMAEQFPKLTISASGGFQALAVGDLWQVDSQVHSVAPLVSWRIFDGGRIRAEISAAEVRQQRAALAYEQSVLAALGEAERALSDYRRALDAVAAQREAALQTGRVHENTLQRFAAGDVALLDVIEAQRQWQDARELEARFVTTASTGLVAVFKALGGGWECAALCTVAGGPAPNR